MDHDLDEVEKKLKEKKRSKMLHKISGRSIFKLQEIIKEKSASRRTKKDGDGDLAEPVAGGQ